MEPPSEIENGKFFQRRYYMEPPNGSKHRPLESKVKSWGNYFLTSISDFVEANFSPSPSSDLDNSSNFFNGSGRDEKLNFAESDESGAEFKPDEAEIRHLNVKTEQKIFSPLLSENAMNREYLCPRNNALFKVESDTNATEDYCFKSKKTNSDFSGEESVDSFNFAAPKGWIKVGNQQLQGNHAKGDVFQSEKCAKVKNSYFYAKIETEPEINPSISDRNKFYRINSKYFLLI